MYRIFFLLIFLSLISCKERPDNTVDTTFFTQDSLYEITFAKPIELDTFYSWMDYDDNACSDEHKYRFSKKDFPAQKETGFFWTSFADSTYRLTFKHVEKYDCKGDKDHTNWATSKEYLSGIITKAKYDSMIIDPIFYEDIKINGKDFSVVAYKVDEKYKNGYATHYINAFTTIDGNLIRIRADCRAKDCNGFIKRMNKSIRTMQIKKIK